MQFGTRKESLMKKYRNAVTGMAVAALLIFVPGVFAKKHQHQSASRLAVDNDFAARAAETNLAEIRMADLAMTKTSNPTVKNLAQRLEADHSKANEQLKQIAVKQNITLPNKLDAKDQAEYDRLSKLSGAEFDKAYTRAQVRDHKAVIAEFRREAAHGTDPEMKKYAADTLPVLEHHLQLAETAESAATKES
jgi:putative membrane protein